jgi:hypothetical protein
MFMSLSRVLSRRRAAVRKSADTRRVERPGLGRPSLEELEQRELPTAVASTLTITGLTQSYNLQTQTETISAQLLSQGVPVVGVPVTFSDGGHLQTANTDASGKVSTTFTFNLFQELPKSHTLSASFPGTVAFSSSSASVTAPDTQQSYFFQLYTNYVILVLFNPGLGASLSGYIQAY